MTQNYVILGDTTCDLSAEIRNKYDIEYIHSHIIYPDGKDRIATLKWSDYKYFGNNCTSQIFYNELKKNPDSFKTSPANIEEIAQVFEKYILQGKNIIYISISSGISGAYNFSLKARELILQKYPDSKINCVDSLRFGSGIGLMLVHAAILRNQGKSFEEVSNYLENNKCKFHQMGWLDDLSFVAKKGRITPVKAFFGTLAGIKTLGEFDYNGLTTPIGRTKGEKSAFDAMLGYIEKTIESPSEQIIFISESNRADKAQIYKKLLQEKFHPKEIIINTVFPPCGINIGPGLLSAYYVGKPIHKGLTEEKALIENLLNHKKTRKQINSINGIIFENMIKCALHNLICYEEDINKINVFPVSDGDTGTNMRFTLESSINSTPSSENLGEYLKNLSKEMLFGARGNSGVILSQIFKGFYISLQEKKCANSEDLAKAFLEGARTARESVVKPVEGTILTVSMESILHTMQKISSDTDLITFFEIYISSIQCILQKTPDYLSILKENGVVDSGGFGYLKIIEGMKNYLLNEDYGLPEDFVKTQHPDCQCSSNKAASFSKDSSFTLGYCLEFILQILESKCSLSSINLQKIKSNLEPLGESLVVVQENSLLKVHIHVKNPVPVINYILNFGEFVSFKLENMQIQHSDNYNTRSK